METTRHRIADPQAWLALVTLTAPDIVFSLDSVTTSVGQAAPATTGQG